MKKKRILTHFVLSLLLFFVSMSCSIASNLSNYAAANGKPQPGDWKGSLQFKNNGGYDQTWILVFTVNKDSNQITQAEATHYFGDLTPDTQVSVLFDTNSPEVLKNNSFEFSFSEMNGFSMDSYTFDGTFTSSTKVKGTLKLGNTIYEWTASPTSLSGAAAPTATAP